MDNNRRTARDIDIYKAVANGRQNQKTITDDKEWYFEKNKVDMASGYQYFSYEKGKKIKTNRGLGVCEQCAMTNRVCDLADFKHIKPHNKIRKNF